MNKVEFARYYAQYRHGDQKYSDDKPYISHLDQVLARVAATGCKDENVLCAAILHDVVEDTEAAHFLSELESLFGWESYRLVLRLTSKTKGGFFKTIDRKKESVDWDLTLTQISENSNSALIKLCDRHHNSSEGKNGRCFEKYKKQYSLMKEKLQPVLSNDNEEINRMWKELDELYL